MRSRSRLQPLILLFTTLATIIFPLLQPAMPVYAWTPQTWNTQAQFNAGVLTKVDISSNPNNVLLATSLDTGDGSDGPLTLNDVYFVDSVSTPVTASSYIGSVYMLVGPNPSAVGFAAGQEVLIIQMTGTGAGTWETNYIGDGGVTPTMLLFRNPLQRAYYADANSQAQVIKVPHYTNVTINPGGILWCRPWLGNGPTGGVIFFRATGTVTVNASGFIDASGMGFQGGSGGTLGSASGGQGGAGGDFKTGAGSDGGVNGGGAKGGNGGLGMMAGFNGGDGGSQGYGGASGQKGTAGGGPSGGISDSGGANGSTASLSLMQAGSGGGGGSSGRQGYGGGGGGGGGHNACIMPFGGQTGKGGSSGGSPGTGGQGGLGAGIIAIHANNIVAASSGIIRATGGTSVTAANGSSGGNGGSGGYGQNFCQIIINGNGNNCGAGGGGGGGNGGSGGGGGNGGGGAGGGVIWLAANNINLAANTVSATGGVGGGSGQGGSGGSGASGGSGGSGDDISGGKNGATGSSGPTGPAGSTGGSGGAGAIRLDSAYLTGTTNPAPGYVSGLYYASGTIASNV
ncbi:MAG: hypothetical protein ACYDHZ_09195, partial [Dehalococcoidia bacterium]